MLRVEQCTLLLYYAYDVTCLYIVGFFGPNETLYFIHLYFGDIYKQQVEIYQKVCHLAQSLDSVVDCTRDWRTKRENCHKHVGPSA